MPEGLMRSKAMIQLKEVLGFDEPDAIDSMSFTPEQHQALVHAVKVLAKAFNLGLDQQGGLYNTIRFEMLPGPRAGQDK